MADGMDTLPKTFLEKNTYGWNKDVHLSKQIKFGVQVERVFETDNSSGKSVTVEATNVVSGKKEEHIGDAVILTVPLHILREMDVPLSIDQQKAVAGLSYHAATKIFLQCKTRFWQKEVGISQQ